MKNTSDTYIFIFKKISLYITIIMSLLLLQLACSNNKDNTIHKITIAEASQSVFALIYIADLNGYFKEIGLDVTYSSFTSGRDALNSVLIGQADVATVYETPVVLKSYEGHDINIISGLHQSNKNTALVTLKENGISEISQLKGKKIAVTLNSNAEFFLSLLLSSNGIKPEQVSLINSKPEKMLSLLKNNSVDAFAVWNPYVHNAIAYFNRNNVNLFYSDVYTEVSVLAAKADYVDSHKIEINKLISAIVKAEDYFQNNNKKSFALVSKFLEKNGTKIIPETWSLFTASTSLDNTLLNILEMEANWFHENKKFTTLPPNFRRIIKEEYLKKIKPDSVKIY